MDEPTRAEPEPRPTHEAPSTQATAAEAEPESGQAPEPARAPEPAPASPLTTEPDLGAAPTRNSAAPPPATQTPAPTGPAAPEPAPTRPPTATEPDTDATEPDLGATPPPNPAAPPATTQTPAPTAPVTPEPAPTPGPPTTTQPDTDATETQLGATPPSNPAAQATPATTPALETTPARDPGASAFGAHPEAETEPGDALVPSAPEETDTLPGQWPEWATMPLAKPAKPARRARRPRTPRDPLAVAVGNASLLGVGYAMLGRWFLAVLTTLVTATLVLVLATDVREVWLELVVLGWWAATVLHGWFLAARQAGERTGVRGQRVVAVAFAVPVLLAFGLLRFDAARIAGDVADAKANGDCPRALSTLEERWAGHRVADAPLTAEGDVTVRACDYLAAADAELDDALGGDVEALRTGTGHMSTVLEEMPGHEKMVEHVLAGFLDRLPTDDACETSELTDRLRETRLDRTADERIARTVPKIAPTSIVTCADSHMAAQRWSQARDRYQQLLDQYPDHGLAGKAQTGLTQATQAIELATVRERLTPSYPGAEPEYCTNPAPYSAAPAYGSTRPNRVMVYGDELAFRLPLDWLAQDPAQAVIIVCAGTKEYGTPRETCTYRPQSDTALVPYKAVTFKNVVVPVRVFELRTGRVVTDTRLEIGGASCPEFVNYQSIGSADLGPPSEMHVTPADGDIHGAYSPLVNP